MSICATPEELERSKGLQLEAQSREAIKAWCDDPSVQLEFMLKKGNKWVHKKTYCWFDLDAYYYRIAAQKKWYRVAKMQFSNGGEYPEVASYCDASPIEEMSGFIEWLDERKYYD